MLLVTAFADLRQAVIAMKGGADDYLAKPVDLDELAAAIHDAIGPADGRSREKNAAIPELPAWFCSPVSFEAAALEAVVTPESLGSENASAKLSFTGRVWFRPLNLS